MSSSRPYLVRAIREWIIDNDLTPLIIVDAKREGVKAPAGTERDGKIVFNISDSAVYRLVIDNRRVEFSARFGGRSSDISIPHHALLAIVARENGVGMSFPLDEEEQDDDARVEKTDGFESLSKRGERRSIDKIALIAIGQSIRISGRTASQIAPRSEGHQIAEETGGSGGE
eukprot:XP_019857383.1 PREDICTED: uncharacterized protein LOC109585701 [Amphimedon queenslandica]